MRRAQEFSDRTRSSCSRSARRDVARIAWHYDRVVERLMALPMIFIHGEFYASNVLIDSRGTELQVCPIDWEMVAVGPGLVDLGALISGRWTDSQQTALALAYHGSLTSDSVVPPRSGALLSAIDVCRLHLAVQWLGWSNDWTPPPEHAQD